MSENEVIEDDAAEMIGESIQEQQELDTIRKLENREEHSVLEASMVKGEPLYPHELSRDTVYTFYVLSIMFYIGAFVPPPLHESADPTAGTAYPPPLPDWYLLWAFGCLKVATDLKLGLPLSMIPFCHSSGLKRPIGLISNLLLPLFGISTIYGTGKCLIQRTITRLIYFAFCTFN